MEWALLLWAISTTILLLVANWRLRSLEKMVSDHPKQTDYPAERPE